MNSKKTLLLLCITIFLSLFFVGQTASACGSSTDADGNWYWDPCSEPAPDPITVATDYGTYSVDPNTGAITDSSGAPVGSVDTNGNITLTGDYAQYSGSVPDNVSGLGTVTVSGSSAGIDYGITFTSGSGISGAGMVSATLIANQTATQLGGGTLSPQMLEIIRLECETNPTFACAQSLVSAGRTLSQNMVVRLGLNAMFLTPADPAALLAELQQRAIAAGALYCTSGNCLNSANFTYGSAYGFGSGWFSTQASGGSGSGSTWTPPPDCEGTTCGGPGGSGNNNNYSWICSYIECDTDLFNQLQSGNVPGWLFDPSNNNGAGGNNGGGYVRPDVKYEEF